MEKRLNRKIAIAGTIDFHLLLVLFFINAGLKQPDPPLKEETVEIQLALVGSSTQVVSENVEVTEPVPVQEPDVPDEVPEDIVTDDNSTVSTPPPAPTPTPKPKPKPKPRVTNDMFNTPSENNPNNPSPGPSNNAGSGPALTAGDGISYSLTGRKLIGKIVTEKPKDEGIVVLRIKVDKSGRVLSATNAPGSTTTSVQLFNIARKAALNAKFDPSSQAAVEQVGILTFHFKLK